MEKTPIEYPEQGKATYRINPAIYPLDIVQAAAYIMLDKAFIILDGDPRKEIIAHIDAKKGEIRELVREFNEELLNYSVYKNQNEQNKALREVLMKRVLITNEVIKVVDELRQEIAHDDPEGIFKPWEDGRDDRKKGSGESGKDKAQ